MFDLKPFVEPVITDVEETQLCLLVVFLLDVLKDKDLGWDETFFNCTSGFTIPSPLRGGRTPAAA